MAFRRQDGGSQAGVDRESFEQYDKYMSEAVQKQVKTKTTIKVGLSCDSMHGMLS